MPTSAVEILLTTFRVTRVVAGTGVLVRFSVGGLAPEQAARRRRKNRGCREGRQVGGAGRNISQEMAPLGLELALRAALGQTASGDDTP